MGKSWLKLLGGVVLSAVANCVVGHVVDCMFQRAGLPCPRDGTA
jgi:hypothetical protein